MTVVPPSVLAGPPASGAAPGASDAPEREALAGLVERVTFHNPETGFCVLRVKVARPARPGRPWSAPPPRSAPASSSRPAGPGSTTARTASSSRPPSCASAPPTTARGDREVPRLRHGQGHRPGLRQAAGRGLRRGACSTSSSSEPERLREVAGIGPKRAGAHRQGLGRAEGRPRDHAVPARARGRHLARGADLQDLRRTTPSS